MAGMPQALLPSQGGQVMVVLNENSKSHDARNNMMPRHALKMQITPLGDHSDCVWFYYVLLHLPRDITLTHKCVV
eukprot:11200699-Lingulodinium_polyedra.AAC.1